MLAVSCATTTRLDGIVLDYDRTTSDSMAKLLVLNIARAHQNLPMHFTGVSNIVATYRFSFSAGFGGAATGDIGWLPVPNVGGGSEENPTISIAPMQGDEFTQRMLTPFEESKLTLLLRQGYDVDALFRMLGAEVRIDTGPPEFLGIHRNRPSDKEGYVTWRRVVSHLSAIQDQHALYVEPLYFQHGWTVPADSVTPEAFATTLKDFSLTLDPAARAYRVTRRVNGRVMISNYDPAELSDAERRKLHEKAEEVPYNDVLIDIREGKPGGQLPLHGRLRLRSFHEVLTFLGRSIEEEKEVDVKPDARTPPVADNPVTTLEIMVADSAPSAAGFSVSLNGRHYAVRPQAGYPWNLKAFALLSQLFEMSVANVQHNGPAITIAK